MKAIFDGLIVLPNEIVNGHVILYEKDIWRIVPRKQFRAGMCSEFIDANGGFVVPGFINEHIHGCAGADVMDDDDQALPTIQQALPATGVTSFAATTMTMEQDVMETSLKRIKAAKENYTGGAQVLGAHLEGPFISPLYKGSQSEGHIQSPDFSWLEPYSDIIKIITLAPEQLKNKQFLKACKDKGIVVSFGHSGASYEQAMDCMETVGNCHVTHLYNAMTPFRHREPGLVGAALLHKNACCELICDDLHVHPAAQKLAYQMKGRNGIILVTDSMRACLQGDGESSLGGQKVFVKNGEARLADGTLAASVAPMNEVVLHFLINSGASLPDVVAMATINPAKALGVYDRIGSLEEGKQADIVVLDSNDFHVKSTVVAGELVYNEPIQ